MHSKRGSLVYDFDARKLVSACEFNADCSTCIGFNGLVRENVMSFFFFLKSAWLADEATKK
jgi:hypothetical protein